MARQSERNTPFGSGLIQHTVRNEMSRTHESPAPVEDTGPAIAVVGADDQIDKRKLSDSELLAKMGYKQELNRTLGLFSSFGVQFSLIAITSALFTTAVVGFGFFGPASFWSYLVGGFCQVFLVGLAC